MNIEIRIESERGESAKDNPQRTNLDSLRTSIEFVDLVSSEDVDFDELITNICGNHLTFHKELDKQ